MKRKKSLPKKHQEQLADSERELFLNAFYQGEYAQAKTEASDSKTKIQPDLVKKTDELDPERALFLEAVEHGLPKNLRKKSPPVLTPGLKKNARKNNLVDGTLDLHGQIAEDAGMMLRTFIERHKRLGSKTLLIIHGIGSGILKQAMWSIVETHPDIDDFQVAPGKMGGAGALIVRINRHVKR